MKGTRIARGTTIAGVIALAIILSACPKGTKSLATASDAISHSLLNAQVAAKQAVQSGVITAQDDLDFEGYVAAVAQAGMILDQGIRANESAKDIQSKVDSFLNAFNQLQNAGLLKIKNPQTKLMISTIINGAEASVAVIAAAVGK